MFDLNEFKANFVAETHNLPAIVAREFDNAISASLPVEKAKAGPIRLICQTMLRQIHSIAKTADWLSFRGTNRRDNDYVVALLPVHGRRDLVLGRQLARIQQS